MKTFIREHPTLLFSFSYLVVIVIGIVYSTFYYQRFDINILKFVDLSDFLLAPFIEPLSIAIFISWLFITILLLQFELFIRRKAKSYGRFVNKHFKPKYSDPIVYSITVIVLTGFFLNDLAIRNVDEIKAGQIDDYSVVFSLKGEQPTETHLAFIGGSSRYLYFYQQETTKTFIIPVENVLYMSKTAKNTSPQAESENKTPNEKQ